MSGVGINQSVLSPAGIQASSIHALWSLMLSACTAVFIAVLAALVVALVRGSRRRADQRSVITSEKTLTQSVGVAVGVTVAILIALLVASVWTGRHVASLHASSAVTIAITGHQWWWEIQYEDAVPSRRVMTANELHIPMNRPVVLKVTSRDVIHSFWVPNLQGKRDLIPGLHDGVVAPGRLAPVSSAASARSSAGCSMRTWPSTSSPSPIGSSRGGWTRCVSRDATRPTPMRAQRP